MEREYRKRKKGPIIHWNPRCNYWPESDFEELFVEDPEAEVYKLCDRCRTKTENEMRKLAKNI